MTYHEHKTTIAPVPLVTGVLLRAATTALVWLDHDAVPAPIAVQPGALAELRQHRTASTATRRGPYGTSVRHCFDKLARRLRNYRGIAKRGARALLPARI